MKPVLYLDHLRLSPYTYSVRSALREKGVDFETREVEFEKARVANSTSWYAGKSFTDLIPALEHRGEVMSESLAILEYVEEVFGGPSLYPADPIERARARMLLSWYRCGFQALREERSTETVFFSAELRAKEPLSAKALDEVADWMNALRSWLKPGAAFLFEGRWTIADSETALMLQRLIRNGDPVEERLVEYADRIWQRASAAEFVDYPRGPYRSYYR
jgi:glutathione S-transferase